MNMPKVTVRLYTTLKDKLGTSRLQLEGENIDEILGDLRGKLKAAESVLFEKGVVRHHFTLALNSEILDPKRLEGVKVKEGDILHIFPPIAGG
jgi:molybdopterin converting factor small subunit